MAIDGWCEVVHQVGQRRADGGVVLGADDDEPKLFRLRLGKVMLQLGLELHLCLGLN